MKSSYCGQVDGIIKNKVTGYERKNIGEGKELRFDKDNVLVKSRSFNLNVPLGAGCIQSTVGDLHKWNQFLHGEKLFSRDLHLSLTFFFTNHAKTLQIYKNVRNI